MSSWSTIYIKRGKYYRNYFGEKIGPAVFRKDIWNRQSPRDKYHWELSGHFFNDTGGHHLSPVKFGYMIECELDENDNPVEKIEDPYPRPDPEYLKDAVKEFFEEDKKWRQEFDDYDNYDLEQNRHFHRLIRRLKERAFYAGAYR